jgi:hypothetical protein
MPSLQLTEQTEQYIISAKNDCPFDELTVDKRKNDKRSMKDMFNFKKVLSFGTIESSTNFLAKLQETLEEKEVMKAKIRSFYPVKLRMKYLNNQLSILEDCFSNDIDEVQQLFPELCNLNRTNGRFSEENTKFKQSFILINMIKKYREQCEELHVLTNNLQETTIKECDEKIEQYKNERNKEFHKTDLYLEMNEEILNLESNREHLLELLKEQEEKNKQILQEKRTLEEKLKSYSQEEDALTMKTLEMNKTEREVREENKKLKKQVAKFKEMILDTM